MNAGEREPKDEEERVKKFFMTFDILVEKLEGDERKIVIL